MNYHEDQGVQKEVDDWQAYELVESLKDPLTGQQLWQCTQCDFSCDEKDKVKEHVEKHIAGVDDQENNHITGDIDSVVIRLDNGCGFQCSVCLKITSTKTNLKRHIGSVHMIEEPAPCEHCGKQFKNSHTLRNHISLNHKGGSLRRVCDICGKECTSSATLYLHRRRTHNISAQRLTPGTEQWRKTFPKEDQEKNQRQCVALTMMTKLGDGSGFMCTKCDKVTTGPAAKGNLKQHIISMHVSDTAKYCKICGKKFKNEHVLSSHISAQHRNPQPKKAHECNLCGKVLRNGAISKHMRRHREDPEFTFKALARAPRALPKKKKPVEDVKYKSDSEGYIAAQGRSPGAVSLAGKGEIHACWEVKAVGVALPSFPAIRLW